MHVLCLTLFYSIPKWFRHGRPTTARSKHAIWSIPHTSKHTSSIRCGKNCDWRWPRWSWLVPHFWLIGFFIINHLSDWVTYRVNIMNAINWRKFWQFGIGNEFNSNGFTMSGNVNGNSKFHNIFTVDFCFNPKFWIIHTLHFSIGPLPNIDVSGKSLCILSPGLRRSEFSVSEPNFRTQ